MSETILIAENLSKHYNIKTGLFGKNQVVRALTGADFSLQKGKTIAVVGESGCGKSTLARLITMIEEPSNGRLIINGKIVERQNWATLREFVQIVFQNPYGSLNPRQRISYILSEPLEINRPDLSVLQRNQKVAEIMTLVGLRPSQGDQYPHMFSGGQRQRIAIARALILSPKLLILDEPVSALDLSIQSQILNLLVDLQEKLELAYLFISHDLSVVRHIADEVMVMYLGRPVEFANKEDVFSHPRHPYTKALLSATPNADPFAKKTRVKLTGELPSPFAVMSGCPFAPRCYKSQSRCHKEVPKLDDAPHKVACFYPEA